MQGIKKLIKTLLKVVLTAVGVVGLYLLFNLLAFHKPRKLDSRELDRYVAAVNDSSSDPFRFVADKFDTHSIVFLGELHKREQDLHFFGELIGYLYREKHLRIIGWEFGSAIDQKDADSVVNAPTFDRRKAIGILRNNLFDWCYEEYLKIFKEIWKINRETPNDGDKIRFLQLNNPYVPRKLFSRVDSIRRQDLKSTFDNFFPGIVENEVIKKGQKILIYCGLHHSLTKFHTPKLFFLKDHGRGGQYLYGKYPNQVYQIALLMPFPSRWALLSGSATRGSVYPFDGVFNQMYDSLKRPFAVGSNNPVFANIRDYNSFYEFDSWRGVKLSDFCDGVIMTASFDSIRTVHAIKDWVVDEKELQEVKDKLPESDASQIKTINDLYRYIDTGASINSIKMMHDLKPFYRP
jgi:hypothetical protein